MYSVSTDYNTIALSNDRTVRCSVYVGNKELDSGKIVSLNFKEATSSGSNISLGEACSSVIELKLYDSTTSFGNGAVIKPKISFSGTGNCPLGVFYVAEYVRENRYTTVTAYDKMALLNEKYYPTISFPATCAEVVNDIKKQYKITLKAGTTFISDRVITNIDCTVREMLGYVAGLNGRNARFNRDGELTFIFYKSAGQPTISEDAVYMNGIEKNPDHDTIKALVSGEGENEIKYGNGKAITFANPFMTKSILDVIGADILPLTYNSGKVKYRCNPAFEVGDIINIQGIGIICIMSNEIVFNGGLYANIESYGLSDEMDVISNYQSNPAELKRRVTMMEQMQNNILGATGGYYELLLDESDNNRPYGTAWWKDLSKTQGWKFTYGGLGYFNNNTLQHIGITNDGSIIADNIATNGLITNTFKIGQSDSNYAMSFDGDTGKITFGSGVTISWDNISSKPDDLAHTSDIPTIPDNIATTDDIPTTSEIVSNLQSNANFNTTVTTITKNSISTASIRAEQITSGKIDAARINLHINSNNPDRSDGINVYYGNSITGMTYNSVGYELTGSSDPIEGACIGKGLYFVSGPALEVWSGSGSNYSYVTPTSIVENGTALSSKYAAYSHTHSGYAPSSHTHSQYYSAGDEIRASKVYISNAGNISGAANARLAVSSPYQIGYASSTRKIKHDITESINENLSPYKFYDLPVVQFKFNNDWLDETDERYGKDVIGFIAEDLYDIDPIYADVDDDGNPIDWDMRYIIPAMMYLIQDQHKEIEALKQRLENIENGQVTNSN